MTELLTTVCRGREVQLLWQPELKTIPDRIAEGFVPIEMAEGRGPSSIFDASITITTTRTSLRPALPRLSFTGPWGRTARLD